MIGLFGALDLARRSMAAQMAGVETAGQNLANMHTPGYSRQRVNLQTGVAIASGIGPQGTGVQAVSIQRIVDDLLNGRIQTQGGVQNYWTAQQSALQNAQAGLNEFLNNTGSTDASTSTATATDANASLSARLTGFFSAAQTLTTANTPANRQLLANAAQSLSTTFNDVSSQLASARTSINTSITNDTDAANKLLVNIADLNRQISSAEASGGAANDLRDRRDQHLESLAKLVNFTASSGVNGAVNVTVGGQTLVSGQTVADTLQTYDAGGGQILIRTATGATPVTPTSGSIAGAISARDTTLAAVQTKVDLLAGTFITQVNALHATGFNANGTSGNSFFTGTNAATMAVNAALLADPSLIQTSGSATATADNSVALAIAQLADSSQAALGNQTFSHAYSAIVGGLGSAVKTANDAVDSQSAVTAFLSAQRNAVSGVSTDEEMTTLLGFQRAYTASAEVLKTVDQMIQTTLTLKQ